MNGFLWLLIEMLGLLTLAALVFFAFGWQWRGLRARRAEAALERRVDDESRIASLARQERDAALAASTTLETLTLELRESQDRQLSLQRELLRLRDSKVELEAEINRLRAEAASPPSTAASPPGQLPVADAPPPPGPLPLTLLRGLGPALEKKLHSAGVRSIQDLGALSPEALAALDRSLKLNGRPQRDRWLEQARSLVDSSTTLPPS